MRALLPLLYVALTVGAWTTAAAPPTLDLNNVQTVAAPGWRVVARTHMASGKSAPALVIAGDLINETDQDAQAPKLRIALRDDEGTEILHWTVLPNDQTVPARGKTAFSARLESPPIDTRAIEVKVVAAD